MNFPIQGHSPQLTNSVTRLTHRPQHVINFFHFKNKTNRTFLSSVFPSTYCLGKRCPYQLPPIPLLPFFLEAACPSQASMPTAPPVTLGWAHPMVSTLSSSHWACQQCQTQVSTLSSATLASLASRTHTVQVLFFSGRSFSVSFTSFHASPSP